MAKKNVHESFLAYKFMLGDNVYFDGDLYHTVEEGGSSEDRQVPIKLFANNLLGIFD